ncbi:MAG: hypothetical protein WCV79_03605 [Candidatus Paceibacterota bacterium]|jgi:hypothetical protein
MILLISYNLNNTGKDYSSFYNTIKSADSWWHYIKSIWMIKTTLGVDEWNERLHAQMAPGDHLLIVDVTNQNRNGWLPKDAWKWIKDNNY